MASQSVRTGPERIMVFQEGALFPWLKVIDNVEFGLKMAGIPPEERSHDIKKVSGYDAAN